MVELARPFDQSQLSDAPEPVADALTQSAGIGVGVARCSSAAYRAEGCLWSTSPTEVLRQDPSRSSMHHEGGTAEGALPIPRRDVYRAQNKGWSRPDRRSSATALEGLSVTQGW